LLSWLLEHPVFPWFNLLLTSSWVWHCCRDFWNILYFPDSTCSLLLREYDIVVATSGTSCVSLIQPAPYFFVNMTFVVATSGTTCISLINLLLISSWIWHLLSRLLEHLCFPDSTCSLLLREYDICCRDFWNNLHFPDSTCSLLLREYDIVVATSGTACVSLIQPAPYFFVNMTLVVATPGTTCISLMLPAPYFFVNMTFVVATSGTFCISLIQPAPYFFVNMTLLSRLLEHPVFPWFNLLLTSSWIWHLLSRLLERSVFPWFNLLLTSSWIWHCCRDFWNTCISLIQPAPYFFVNMTLLPFSPNTVTSLLLRQHYKMRNSRLLQTSVDPKPSWPLLNLVI